MGHASRSGFSAASSRPVQPRGSGARAIRARTLRTQFSWRRGPVASYGYASSCSGVPRLPLFECPLVPGGVASRSPSPWTPVPDLGSGCSPEAGGVAPPRGTQCSPFRRGSTNSPARLTRIGRRSRDARTGRRGSGQVTAGCRTVLRIADAPEGYEADRCGAKGVAGDGRGRGAGWRRLASGPAVHAEPTSGPAGHAESRCGPASHAERRFGRAGNAAWGTCRCGG